MAWLEAEQQKLKDKLQDKMASVVKPRSLFDTASSSNEEEESEENSTSIRTKAPIVKTPPAKQNNKEGEKSQRLNLKADSRLDDPDYEESWKELDTKKLVKYHPEAVVDFSKPYRPTTSAGKSKFVAKIAEAELPENPKIPPMVGQYDGILDPDDHLQTITAAGLVSGWTMPLWCHIFTLTLVGDARAWFERLPDGQITSWEDLANKFTQQFSQQRRHISDPAGILNVVRKDTETLEDFITRFNQEGLNIGGASEELMRAAFRQNVKCDDLIRNLTGRDGMPQRCDDVMTAAKRYARMEKSLGKELAKNDARNDINRARQGKRMSSVWSRLNSDRESATFEPFKATQKSQTNAPQTNVSRWTPLTKSPTHIMYSEGIQLKKPTPVKQGLKTYMKIYCDFHEQHGHTTNQCVNLKDAFEEYVKNGKLDHLVRNIWGKYRRPLPKDGGRLEKKIKDLHANMISGKAQTKKRRQTEWAVWKEEQVIFPIVRRGPNKKAPLVITAVFGNYRTPRFFVNAGATSNTLYRQSFDLLEEKDRHQLTAANAPIAGFNQSIEYPLGQLTFPVELSDGLHSRTEDVDFLVMETPHPQYDIILKREAIGDFNATPSTAHGILGVPTPTTP
ncbi:uncharacterized protein LOC143634537 [Bidens hawaiensis]|uniref:uncharacterized protein LOC143634537 n=1 Tax=Bidens hawaiensis TaxID=980011 RepID=UPI00404A29D0